jgi:hypothetical protein
VGDLVRPERGGEAGDDDHGEDDAERDRDPVAAQPAPEVHRTRLVAGFYSPSFRVQLE